MDHRTRTLILIAALLGLASGCGKLDGRSTFKAYQWADQRFAQSEAWNAEHTPKVLQVPTDSYSLYVQGDSHIGTTVNLRRYLDSAIINGAIATVMVGDLTNGHAEDFENFDAALPHPDSMTCMLVAGNHDLYYNGWDDYFRRFGSSTYYFSVETPVASDLYICVESGGGTLGTDQMTWLEDVLKQHRHHYRKCVIFTHVNLFRIRHTLSGTMPVEEMYALNDLCIGYEVDMVVAGHDHEKNQVALGNTTHLTMDALLDGAPNAGYLVLQVAGDSLGHRFVNF